MINPFIDEVYFKKNNSLDMSIDNKLIEPMIIKAQDFYILDLIGTALYLELQNQIQLGTVTSNNVILLNDYIAPCLSKYSLYEVLPKLLYKIENTGVVKRGAEFAEVIDFKELTYLRQIAKDDGEYFGTKLTKYLIANPLLYPLYTNAGNSIDTVYPNHNKSYTTSIHFSKKSGRFYDRKNDCR